MKYSNNTISLNEDYEEENTNYETKGKGPSFFSKLYNSMSKLGRSLTGLMSIKLDYDNDEDYSHTFYDQDNKFNIKKIKKFDISPNIFDAPSNINQSKNKNINLPFEVKEYMNNYKNVKNNNMIEKNDKNISSDESLEEKEIKNEPSFPEEKTIINNNILQKEEPIMDSKDNNNIILKNNQQKKLDIKSTLLNKKRKLESIKEEKEEEEEIKISKDDKNKIEEEKDKINNNDNEKMNLSLISAKSNNSLKLKSLNNSLSMKSLDKIKDEIIQSRGKASKLNEELYNRHKILNYDYDKEKKLKNELLERYYKLKSEKKAEVMLKIEADRKKREENFKNAKLRLKKYNMQFLSQKKKPKFSVAKGKGLQFFGKAKQVQIPQLSNQQNLDFSFGPPKNNEIKFSNTVTKTGDEQKNETKENKETKTNEKKEEVKNLFSNNTKSETSLFNLPQSSSKSDVKNETKETKQNTEGGLFGNISPFGVKSKDEKEVNNSNSLFGSFNPGTSLFGAPKTQEDKKKEEKNTNNQNIIENKGLFQKSDDNFFFQSTTNIPNQSGNPAPNLFQIKPKEGIFNQNTPISSAMNQNSLFVSNSTTPTGSLFKKDNPFISNDKSPNVQNIFTTPFDNNQSQQKNTSLFQGEGNMFSSKGLFSKNN